MNPQWVLIAVAGDEDSEGGHLELKMELYDKPTDEVLADARCKVVCGFERAFNEKPARVGVVYLPYYLPCDPDDVEAVPL